ncbi:MAG: ABC transporter permease [Candidatus Bathyarchaeota archaeon]|nr:ABC transporter permease [Candidatus Bathyarchaeota archaeon]
MRSQRIRALSVKDLKRVIRDPAVLFMVFIFPLVLTAAFGAAFGNSSGGGDATYTVGLVDMDASSNHGWAEAFRDGIEATGALVVAEYPENASAHDDLLQGTIDAIVVLPEVFGDSVESFLLHPDDPGQWVNTTIGLAVDQGSMIVGAVVPPLIGQVLSSILFGEAATNTAVPLELGTPAQVASSHLNQFDYMVPGMFAYSAIFITLLVAQAFSSEREQGLMKRISLTPTSSSEVILSQVVTNLILGAAQVGVVYATAYMMGFRPMTAAVGVAYALVIVLFLVLCNVGFGLITASIVKSSSAATGVSFIFILPQMLLGTFVPASPELAKLVPSHYVTDALTSLFLRGAPLTSPVIMNDLIVVAVVGVATVAVGIAVFQRFGRG